MQSIFRQLRSFRLGYTEEHPYPWKWTTPIVLSAFILISVFLAALNVPLSAYNIVQEFTYRPNDTLPAVALSSLVPSLLTVGDIIKLNGSLFEYTVVDAFDGLDETKPVSSFSYFNNPLSKGCDVTNVTINFVLKGDDKLWGFQCEMRSPTLFHLAWTGNPCIVPAAPYSSLENMVSDLTFDIMFYYWPGYDNATLVNITATVHACCICDPAGSPETTTLLEPLCSLAPPRFMATRASFVYQLPWLDLDIDPSPAEKAFPLMSTEALKQLAGQLGNVSTPDFTSAFQNVFQAIYHLVRLDLGVIIDNQIYNAPQMFNLSIMPVNISHSSSSYANGYRATTSNSTLMAQWRERVAFYNTSDHVPVMDYLRPVPRLKPLGSAITSVFVSTFTMLSALWTIFSLGAGALARRTAPPRQRWPPRADSEETICGESDSGWDTGTSSGFAFHQEAKPPCQIPLQHLQDDMREMKRMVRLLLEKEGLADDHDASTVNPSVMDGILSLLVRRPSTSSE
ncbi:hypothetical protein B0H14DRAFT_3544229 [Mycena olivaceomarginata]|nr:hypothetical protein B0H14DRAFT_3544229 [Mycena olivaceomarginata]